MKNEPKNKPYQHIPLNDPFGDEIQDNRETQECQDDQEFAGLEQPNLYHFNINNETEDQAVKRLDAEIRVCMRQYTITAIRDKAMELPDVTYMMKLYMKLVGQELRARELSIKERQLALRERAMALKEAQAAKASKASAQKNGEDGKGIAGPESPSPAKEVPATSSSLAPSSPAPSTEPKKPGEAKSPLSAPELKAAKKIIEHKNGPKQEPYPDMISEDGTGSGLDAIIIAAGNEHCLEPLKGKAKKAS